MIETSEIFDFYFLLIPFNIISPNRSNNIRKTSPIAFPTSFQLRLKKNFPSVFSADRENEPLKFTFLELKSKLKVILNKYDSRYM